MPIYDRRYANTPLLSRERFHHVPRLDFDVTHQARHMRHDVRQRRARSDRDHYHHHHHNYHYPRRPPRPREKDPARAFSLSTRASSYGYDGDYFDDYFSDFDTARVRLYTHDGHDPYSCTCFPRVSSPSIPSMMYDRVRCPHPDHRCPPGKLDYFTYPWTAQSYRPNVTLEYGYRKGQIKPPSAVTAPPFQLYNAKEHNPSKGSKPPPYSAPEKPAVAPLLTKKPSDRRLRRADRQRVAAVPVLDTVDEDLSPFDSVSQAPPVRSYRPPSLRLRTVDAPVLGRVESEMRLDSTHRALSTPRALRPLNIDGFPETPNRIFKGEYVDSSGQKYEYDIRYGKSILDGKRTRLETI